MTFNIRHATHEEMMAEFEARGGRGGDGWTEAEKAYLFGDANHSSYKSQMAHECELLYRYAYGLALSRSDEKEARRTLRGYHEMSL